MAAVQTPENPHRRAFAILFAATLLTASGNTALQAVLAVIGRQIGIKDTLIVGVFSASAIMWTLVSTRWAKESDRRGRKPMVIVGVSGFCLSMLGFALAVWAGLHHWAGPAVIFAAMLVARSLYGLIGSAATPAAQAYVADRTQGQGRVQALATLASAIGLGTVIGPTLAPFLVLPILGLAGPMLIFALIGLVMAVVVWRLLPAGDFPGGPRGQRPTRAARPAGGLWLDRRVLPFIAWGFMLASCQAINTQALAFQVIDSLHVTAERAERFIGIGMLAGALATLVGQWGLIPHLKMTPRSLLRAGAALAAAGNLMIAFAPDYYTVVVAYAVLTLGFGLARPGYTAGASLAVGPEAQGEVAGMMAAISGACYVLSPLIGMALYEQFHPTPFLLNVAILTGLAVAAFTVRALAKSSTHRADDDPVEDESAPGLPPV